MRILREDCAAIIIDVQEKLFPHIFQYDDLEKHIGILIAGLQRLGIPMIVTEQYKKGLGDTISSIQEKFSSFKSIEKISFSCCDESRFLMELRRLNKKFVILAGIETHVCVLQTILDLIEMGFVPVLVSDCVSSRKEHDKLAAIERIRQEGAVITTCESVLLELCRVAGNETFKEISRLIK